MAFINTSDGTYWKIDQIQAPSGGPDVFAPIVVRFLVYEDLAAREAARNDPDWVMSRSDSVRLDESAALAGFSGAVSGSEFSEQTSLRDLTLARCYAALQAQDAAQRGEDEDPRWEDS